MGRGGKVCFNRSTRATTKTFRDKDFLPKFGSFDAFHGTESCILPTCPPRCTYPSRCGRRIKEGGAIEDSCCGGDFNIQNALSFI